jgi:hypothetical protein
VAVVTIYFRLGNHPPLMRCWPLVPRVGEKIALPELSTDQGPFTVLDVVWEGFDIPSATVHVHRSAFDQPDQSWPNWRRDGL